MLFVVRRMQELGLERKEPLYMCFIELEKAYDSVDRQLLWEVLTRFGEEAKILTVIRKFNGTDDGELSEGYAVTQGLRHGRVLSPVLFNALFAGLIHVVLVRLSEDKQSLGIWSTSRRV